MGNNSWKNNSGKPAVIVGKIPDLVARVPITYQYIYSPLKYRLASMQKRCQRVPKIVNELLESNTHELPSPKRERAGFLANFPAAPAAHYISRGER